MAKERMAGEVFSRADKHRAARERIAASPERTAERLSGLDRDAYDFSDYDDKDIVMAMQGKVFGDEDYARLTGVKPGAGGGGGDEVVTEPVPGGGVTSPAVPEGVVVTNNMGPQIDGDALAALLSGIPKGGMGSGKANQRQSFDRTFGNNRNTMGGGNTIYGSFNQGNQDNSMNFGYQGAY